MQPQLLTVIKEEALKTWTSDEWSRWWIEPKRDGYRLTYHKGQFLSRTGKPFHNLEHIAAELAQVPGITFDGELYGPKWEDAAAARRSKNGQNNDLKFAVFDCMTDEEWSLQECDLFLKYRRSNVAKHLVFMPGRYVERIPHYRVADFDAFYNMHQRHLVAGCDGTVLKLADSLYEFKRTKTWLKVKPVETFDGRITGVYPGEGKHEGRAGGVEFLPEGAAVQTRVGTGFSDQDRQALWDYPMEFVGKTIEVAARGVHKSGRLIEPRFVRIREDK